MIAELPLPPSVSKSGKSGTDVIDFDVPCIKCGYNLRTQHAGGVCPECAHRILSSIDEHLRRRVSRFELARMKDRPLESVRSIRLGAGYAILANILILVVIHLPTWMFKRRTPWRIAILVLVCIALASAAMSIWRFAVKARADRKMGVGPWLLRAGAIGAIAYPVLVTLTNDYLTFGLRFLHTDFPYFVGPAAWLMGLGVSLRLIYAQWWLRLEGWWVLGWPLLVCALPFAFFFLVVAPLPIHQFYWGNFVGLDFFLELPLASGSWPSAITEFEGYISRSYYSRYPRPEVLIGLMIFLAHGLVALGDIVLATIASRDLRRRSTPLSQIVTD